MYTDKAITELIEKTVGVRRSYSWNQLYEVVDRLVTLMTEDDGK
jgi:hypothetical protein